MASLLALFSIHLLIITLKGVEYSVVAVGDKWSISTVSGLYVASDKVALLSADNFNTNVYNSSSAWLVQFYNSWCGHCIKFSPIWKQLAADIYNWRNMVKISAIDCADDQNTQHCRDYEIMGYPTIRYFEPLIAKFTIGDEFPREKDDADYLRKKIVSRLELTEKSSFNHSLPRYWPRLSSIDNLTNTDDVNILILTVENDTAYTGRELILDSNGVPPASADPSDLIVRRLVRNDRNVLPEIRVYTKNRTYNGDPIPIVFDDRRSVYNSVATYLRQRRIYNLPDPFLNNRTGVDDNRDYNDQNRHTVTVKQSFKQTLLVNAVFQTDLETALSYSLFHEIPLKSHIEDDKLQALLAYVRVLSKYFPIDDGDEADTRLFLANLAQELSSYDRLTGSKFKELLLKYGREFSQKRHQWIGCKGSTSTYRGYPCGLWMMFHTLTARKYVIAEPSDNDPAEVLNAMTGYITKFFGCQDCAEHFAQMSSTIAGNATTNALAVLWLWRAHNNVNRRLAGDGSEDPSFPKMQFPLASVCPECRLVNDTPPDWNETNVLSYLITMYTNVHPRIQEDAVSFRLQSNENDSDQTSNEDTSKSWWKNGFFNANSYYIVLYVLCACILTVYATRFFLKRNPTVRGRAKYDISTYKA